MKKSRVFCKAGGDGWRAIFRILGILPKMIDWTNGERSILFRGV